MELHKGTVSTVSFKHPAAGTTVTGATYSIDGATPVALVVSTNSGVSSAPLPYIHEECSVDVSWTFTVSGSTPYTKVDKYEFVTPYLTIDEVKEIWPEATDQEAKDVERVVRHIINAHCGQSFGKRDKTIVVEGHGETALRLPERLINLTGLNTLVSELDPNGAIIISDGWYLKKRWLESTGGLSTESTYWNDEYGHGGVIYAPSLGGNATQWRDDYPFSVTGTWGWESIPEPIREAARLLVNDYACSEQAYRDKYLESIKAADWRLQYSSRAWDFTGNVRADQLLGRYVLLDWAVV